MVFQFTAPRFHLMILLAWKKADFIYSKASHFLTPDAYCFHFSEITNKQFGAFHLSMSKTKLFDDFLRSIFINNQIPDMRMLKKPKESTYFVARSYVYPYSCDFSELTINLTTCVPKIIRKATLYHVNHLGYVDEQGSTKLELKLPSMMVYEWSAEDGKYREFEIDMEKCRPLGHRLNRCAPEAKRATTCKVFSTGTCESRLMRGQKRSFKMDYASNVRPGKYEYVDCAVLCCVIVGDKI
ncbi:hypothetical protein QR680_008105 [Steinernema hermaphroditum]|uniref:Uncharacterized protein n=1 Tax=Steinernema hermaphroditum TaxID=289476 RepID=A0AA39M7I1_9BILA|nr:hypothetical protein QR680_008105 [Steinernema hermaphroditum]